MRLVPRRVAPSSMNFSASASEAMPPAALMPLPGAMCAFISATSSNVAPAVEKPVLVLMKSASERLTMPHMRIFSSSLSRQVSMITLSGLPAHAAFTALISASTSSSCPSLSMPMLMTMSISSAPFFTASAASNALTAVVE